jgi:hypothetical protein
MWHPGLRRDGWYQAAMGVAGEEIMNRRKTAVAMAVLALGGITVTAGEASAIVKDPPRNGTVSQPVPVATQVTESGNGATTEVVASGVSALGGAGIAFAGMWVYRRRRTATA